MLSLAFPVASLAADKNSIIEDLVVANHILAYKDVVDGYGNVSVRNPKNPNQYFMARSMAPALVSKSDIMTFDLDNNPVGKDTREAYVERFIHGEIYRARPDVNAIVDCHSSALIPFGVTNIPLRPLSDMTAFIASGVPVFEIRDFRPAGEKNMLVNNRELGQALARVLGKGAAALMRGHGAVIVGTSLSQVAGRSFYLDINAKLEMETIALGQPVSYLEPGEGMPSSANLYRNDWEAWKNEVEEDEEDD
ncbi:MAG: class II aldolase/adducin family protein [Candidatus Korobacteraceae bacterium]